MVMLVFSGKPLQSVQIIEILFHLLISSDLLDIGSEIEHNGHPLFNQIPSGSGSGFKVVLYNIAIWSSCLVLLH